jgi:hypothetical protein
MPWKLRFKGKKHLLVSSLRIILAGDLFDYLRPRSLLFRRVAGDLLSKWVISLQMGVEFTVRIFLFLVMDFPKLQLL